MNLLEINFPIFRLGNSCPLHEGSLYYYEAETYNNNTDAYSLKIRVVDDTSINFPTLSRRRLVLKQNPDITLYKINTAVYFIGDLIKLGKKGTWWIDSLGKIFEYKKSERAKLKFYKLDKWFANPGMGAIVQVQGLPQRFKTMFMPSAKETWCGILEHQGLKIFYGYYTESHKETWRMI